MPIRIGIVDDQLFAREFVRKCCLETGDFEVVMEAETGAAAVEGIVSIRPEAVLLDLGLPDFDGFEVVRRIRIREVNPQVIVVSAYCTPYSVYRLQRFGIRGFIHKPSQTAAIVRSALKALREGRSFFATVFLEAQNNRRADPSAFDKLLTEEQLRIMSLAAKHFSDNEIAAHLASTEQAIETHMALIMRIFDIRSRNELIRF